MSDDPITAAEPAAETAPAPQAPPVDWGQLEDRLGPMLDQRLAALKPEPEPEPDIYENELGGLYEDPNELAQARETLQNLVRAEASGLVEPLQRQIAELTSSLDYGDLEAKYPGLQDPDVQQQVVAEAGKVFASVGGAQNAPVPAALIEQAYLARIGRERAQSEAPAGGHATALESAGGAAPPMPEADIAQSIVNADGPRTPGRSFWT